MTPFLEWRFCFPRLKALSDQEWMRYSSSSLKVYNFCCVFSEKGRFWRTRQNWTLFKQEKWQFIFRNINQIMGTVAHRTCPSFLNGRSLEIKQQSLKRPFLCLPLGFQLQERRVYRLEIRPIQFQFCWESFRWKL